MGATKEFAEFVVRTKSADIPQDAVERARFTFLDIIGVMLAGAAVGETGKMAIRYVRDLGGVIESSVVGSGLRTSAPNAAFANGLLAHALDFDDWEITGGHPSAPLVASCLALGEKLDASGRDVIAAYIIGLEVYDKISTSCPGAQKRGWHGAAVFGTMGATAAAARLLHLDMPQTIAAFGIAASTASGLARQHGNMTKPVQIGKAARNGVESALLAQYGFTSDEAIIENPKGFCETYLGEGNCDFNKMTSHLGKPFHVVSPGTGIKFYPCRYPEFRTIDAILALRSEYGFTCDDVERVEIGVSPGGLKTTLPEPRTGLEGKFSTRYICLRAIMDGQINLSTFTDEKVRDPKTKEGLKKVELVADPAIPREWLKSRSPVKIILKDGRILSKQIEKPKGDPRNPLPLEAVIVKYVDNASLVLSERAVKSSNELIQNLDHLKSINELMLLVGSPIEKYSVIN